MALRWFFDHQAETTARIERAQALITHPYSLEAIVDRWEQLLLSCESIAALSGHAGEAGLRGPKLNLGCGNHPLPGYLNIDVAAERAGVSPDISCDVRQLLLLPDACAKEIAAILREWVRVLLSSKPLDNLPFLDPASA